MRGGLTLVLLLAPLLAGCLNLGEGGTPAAANAAQGEGGVPVMDAIDGVARARELARAWQGDAALGAVIGAEGFRPQPEDPPFLYDSSHDVDVGDGLAVAWTYAFYSATSPKTFLVTIAADGSVPYAHDLDAATAPRFGAQPAAGLGDPLMPSKDAAALVLANETARAFQRDHPVSFAHLALAAVPGGPLWDYGRTTTSGFSLHATIDARGHRLVEVSRYPEDIRTCPADASCGPGGPMPPQPPAPPPTPPEERTSKNATLDAFNQQVRFDVQPTRAGEFEHRLVIAADVGGSTPLDERTLHVSDPMGMPLGEKTGTGRLEVVVDDASAAVFGGYRIFVDSKTPIVAPQNVAFTAVVTYGAYGRWMQSVTSSGGSAGFQQVDDRTFDVPRDVVNVTFRIAFFENGPALHADAKPSTWQLLAPDGKAVASGTAPGGKAKLDAPAPGVYTVRVTGGAGALFFGESYRFAALMTPRYAYGPPV
jgi:hypothetical protein